jgi:glycosyltransferase involved in cell wall biosynthesis
MKIVYVNPFFTDGMGYIENCLPKAMAKRGHEVHLITSTGKVYFNDPVYKSTYEKFFGPPIEPVGRYSLPGNVTHHRLDFRLIQNTIYFKGLRKVLEDIQPDVVHMWDVVSPYTLQFFLLRRKFNYVVYTGNHYVLSVLKVHNEWNNWLSPLKWKWLFLKVIPGKILSGYYRRCYAATVDAKFIAEKYMGVPAEKCVVTPLGVDADIFTPEKNREVVHERKSSLGYQPDDFIALYTGRFARDKNPLVLAKAIEILQTKGFSKIKGLFVGSGDQKNEIKACPGCQIVDFVLYKDLYKFYQIADIGVWPAQESTSMLDAASTGVPIIVNDTVQATERFEGNGLSYRLGDPNDLADKILKLYQDEKLRVALGKEGERKMSEEYSWDRIAKEREQDYIQDLKSHRP